MHLSRVTTFKFLMLLVDDVYIWNWSHKRVDAQPLSKVNKACAANKQLNIIRLGLQKQKNTIIKEDKWSSSPERKFGAFGVVEQLRLKVSFSLSCCCIVPLYEMMTCVNQPALKTFIAWQGPLRGYCQRRRSIHEKCHGCCDKKRPCVECGQHEAFFFFSVWCSSSECVCVTVAFLLNDTSSAIVVLGDHCFTWVCTSKVQMWVRLCVWSVGDTVWCMSLITVH